MTKIEEDIIYKKIKAFNKAQKEFFKETMCELEIINDYKKSDLLNDNDKKFIQKTIDKIKKDEPGTEELIIKYYIIKRKNALSILIFFDMTEKLNRMVEIVYADMDGEGYDYYVTDVISFLKESWQESLNQIIITGINLDKETITKIIYFIDKIEINNLVNKMNKLMDKSKEPLKVKERNETSLYLEIRNWIGITVYCDPMSIKTFSPNEYDMNDIINMFDSEEEYIEFCTKKLKEEKELKNEKNFTEKELNMINDMAKEFENYIDELDKKQDIVIN